MKRGLTALGVVTLAVFSAAILLAVPAHEAQAQAAPQVQPPENPTLGQLIDQALETEFPPAPEPALQTAILQGLNKTTARVSTIRAPIGTVAKFGTLEITARTCTKKPPTETPESTVFLEIIDVRPDSPSVAIFTGWMFASSPAISALEHPVYDVWVIDCIQVRGGDTAELPPSEEKAAPAGQGSTVSE